MAGARAAAAAAPSFRAGPICSPHLLLLVELSGNHRVIHPFIRSFTKDPSVRCFLCQGNKTCSTLHVVTGPFETLINDDCICSHIAAATLLVAGRLCDCHQSYAQYFLATRSELALKYLSPLVACHLFTFIHAQCVLYV